MTEKVKNLLVALVVQPEVFPTANDSIQFEFDGPDHSYLEFQIRETPETEILCINKVGDETEWKIESTATSLNEVIKEFYGPYIL